MADILDFPPVAPQSMQWGLAHNTKSFTSAFNGATQTVTYPGARWRCQMTFGTLRPDEERMLSTFINRLGGRAGRFRLSDLYRVSPVSRGNAVVDGGGQTGGLLRTRGWIPSRRVLRMGDYVTVDNEMKEVLDDVWSDAGGKAVLRVAPWWRFSPTNAATVNHTSPVAIMMLDDDENMIGRQRRLSNCTITCTEAFS
ncbi:hypothetical protein MRB56_12630 [Halomonas cupida]|uniref:hypothetical protein n=1 Tax=Halomonas cupida TaxID=44933 RepID=UPI0039B5F1B5